MKKHLSGWDSMQVAYLSHGVNRAGTQLMGQVVTLHQTDSMLTLERIQVSRLIIDMHFRGQLTVTVPSISTALLTILWTTSSAIFLSASL